MNQTMTISNLLKPVWMQRKVLSEGRHDEQIDAYEDITIAVLVLTQDMYDNRRLYVEKSNVNKVVDSIIYQYAENWL